MSRPAKPPRLELRGHSYYLVDSGRKIATGTRDPAVAQAKLAQYVAGQASAAAKKRRAAHEETVSGMLDFYRQRRLEELQRKANSKAYQATYWALLAQGRDAAEAHRAAEQAARVAAEGVTKIGNDEHVLARLREALGRLYPWQIDQTVVDAYTDGRRTKGISRRSTGETIKRLSDSTIDRELNILASALNTAWDTRREVWFGGHAKPTFTKPVHVAGRGRLRYLSKGEAAHLIACCHLPHIRLLFRIMLATGARRGAVEELRWENVDFEGNFIDFGRVDPDNNKRRPLIQMAPELRRELSHARQMACSPYVIEFRGGRAGNTKKSVRAALVKAGLAKNGADEDAVGHTLKHTFVTWMLAAGRTWEEIAMLIDTSAAVLRRTYGHLDRAVIAKIADAVALDADIQRLEWHPTEVANQRAENAEHAVG
jgi:integrase